jgi:hypothetical protein
MTMQSLAGFVLALSLAVAPVASADQIDNEAAGAAPAGIMVKVNPDTKTVEVFKAPILDANITNKTASEAEQKAMTDKIENPLNKIAEFKLSTNELDKDSSTEAWGCHWYRPYYRWNNWCGYRPYYYNWSNPYYYGAGNFCYGNYNYYYNYGYSYNNCHYGWYY